jgi:hypothetical protein
VAEGDELAAVVAEVLIAWGYPCGVTNGGAGAGSGRAAISGIGGGSDPRTVMEGAE